MIARLVRVTALALAACFAASVQAQAWPTKPLRWILPFPPGGPADLTARTIAPRLAERLGQPVVIDNRPGANSNIAYDLAARAAPDGYTLLFIVAGFVTNPHLYKLSWDPLKDFTAVAQMNQLQLMLVANAKFGPNNLAETLALARAKPGAVRCAWGGSVLMQLGCEMLRIEGKADVIVVPYKGGAPAMNDLVGGQVELMMDVINTAIPQIKAGRAKPIALANPARGREPYPEVGTMGEVLNGFELSTWQGIAVPAGTPREIVARLNRDVNSALAEPELAKRVVESGLEVVTTSPEAFADLLQREYVKYGRLIRAANIKVD